MKYSISFIIFFLFLSHLQSQSVFSKVWDPDGLDVHSWVKHSVMDKDTMIYFAHNVCNYIDDDNYNLCTTIGRMDKNGNILTEVTYNDLVWRSLRNAGILMGDHIYVLANEGRYEDPRLYILKIDKNSLELVEKVEYELGLDVSWFYQESSLVEYKDYLVASGWTELASTGIWQSFLLWIDKYSLELKYFQFFDPPFEFSKLYPELQFWGDDDLLTVYFIVLSVASDEFPGTLGSSRGFMKYNRDRELVFHYLDTLSGQGNSYFHYGLLMENGSMVYHQPYNHRGFEIQNGADFEVISINQERQFNWRFNQVGFSPYGKKQLLKLTETADGNLLGCGRLYWHFNYPNLHEFNFFTDTIPPRPDSLEYYQAPYIIKIDSETGEMLWEYALIDFKNYGYNKRPESCQGIHELSDGTLMGYGPYSTIGHDGMLGGISKSWAFRIPANPCPEDEMECGFERYLTNSVEQVYIDLNAERRFTFFPNPGTGTFYLKDALGESNEIIINLYDSTGRLIDRKRQYSTDPFYVADPVRGIIYVEIFDKQRQFIQSDLIMKQ
ncbi:MAG: hypothetical protein EA409_05720 [Saprospirales bacterium]|nr:MAG: hypothetical protein EA409_05720 [Saprospirales bacterium]